MRFAPSSSPGDGPRPVPAISFIPSRGSVVCAVWVAAFATIIGLCGALVGYVGEPVAIGPALILIIFPLIAFTIPTGLALGIQGSDGVSDRLVARPVRLGLRALFFLCAAGFVYAISHIQGKPITEHGQQIMLVHGRWITLSLAEEHQRAVYQSQTMNFVPTGMLAMLTSFNLAALKVLDDPARIGPILAAREQARGPRATFQKPPHG